MKPNQRVQAVCQGQTPDQVPLMLDLSHWYKRNMNTGFNLAGYTQVEQGLVDLHKQVGAVAYYEMVEFLMMRLQCTPKWEWFHAWKEALGDLAYPYAQLPYSGSGYLISRNMGVEKTVFAILDELEIVRKLVDGESRSVLAWLAECGVDCADAVTPAPMFAQTPAQMRTAAGPELILSGGIPATVFGATGSDAAFGECVKRWLEIRHTSPRLIMAAGDQVPTDAPFHRIAMLPELVANYGGY